jgi:hypothetical protein
MPTSNQSAKQPFLSLREAFRTTFPWNHQRLTRDGFRQWARAKRIPPININAHHWRPMRDGKPVPRPMIEAFSEFIALHQILPPNDCRLSVIAEQGDAPAASKASSGGRQRPYYALTYRELYFQLCQVLAVDDHARCEDESDLWQAARMIVECVGWHEKRLSGKNAIAYGEGLMRRSLDDYAQELLGYWQANEHAVMFATLRQGNEAERIGVSVSMPVTEAFYRRMRSGEADESRIASDDLAPQSQYVLALAFAENVAIDLKRNKVTRSLVQTRTAMYQLSSLFLPVQHEAWQPHILTFAGTGENGKRMRAYGFSPTGARLPSSGREIVEFAPPDKEKHGLAYCKALAEYLPMRSLIQVFQAYIESQRRLDD